METGEELMMALSYSYDLVKSGPEDGAREVDEQNHYVWGHMQKEGGGTKPNSPLH